MLNILAFDYGASSGRAMLGKYDGRKILLEEIHRFNNEPVYIRGSLYWDILRLYNEIEKGIMICNSNLNNDIASIGIDTWGVDFGLLDEGGQLIGNPYHYRDKRTDGIMEKAFDNITKEYVFSQTGIQFLWFNTIYQLFSMKLNNSYQLDKAKTLLMIPDLLNYFLTGVISTEYTNATTTQLFNIKEGTWAKKIMDRLNIPNYIFTDVTKPGTIIGKLNSDISQRLSIDNIPVVAVASHDTASAVVAIPAQVKNYAYISCGTWSLMGVEINDPIITDKGLSLNFTNEGGANDTIRLLKNIMGTWIIQECKRQWEREGQVFSFSELAHMASKEEGFVSFIDPDNKCFASPGNMPGQVRRFCANTRQPVPESNGQIIRCITQSLALKYRYTIERLEEILGEKLDVIHMVGGGIKDKMLCQFTANATNRQVIAGPAEATAIGNIVMQAIAIGEIKDVGEARCIIRDSFEMVNYEPKDFQEWDEAYNKYLAILNEVYTQC